MIMPLIKMKSNPIMNMPNEIPWIEKTQGIFGILYMILLMLIVKDNEESKTESIFLYADEDGMENFIKLRTFLKQFLNRKDWL